MPEQRLQRWTDVALKRGGGTEITKGAGRRDFFGVSGGGWET